MNLLLIQLSCQLFAPRLLELLNEDFVCYSKPVDVSGTCVPEFETDKLQLKVFVLLNSSR